MTDQDLLQQFLATRNEQAFAELVRRYIPLVYASAQRQVRDPAAAEDVTQSVFILFAQKAPSIRSAASIPGWLLVTTRCVAINTIRSQIRRQRHESEAAAMKQESQPQPEPSWDSIGPLLDEAVATLRADDRDALTLRYFQNQPLIDVANALGISEPAARKRVQRAIEKLRRFFASRGVVTSAEALGAMLPAHVLTPAPASALCAQIAHTAVSTTQTIATGSSAGTLKGAVLLMTATKTNMAIACTVAALAIGVTSTITYLVTQGAQPAVASAQTTPPASQPTGDWRDRFNRIYSLHPGETIKRIPAPFPEERTQYCQEQLKLTAQNGRPDLRMPGMIVFETDGSELKIKGVTLGANTLRDILNPVAGILSVQTNLPREMLNMPVAGDWILRKGATQAERIDGFSNQLESIFGPGMVLKPRQVEREAIVASGALEKNPTSSIRVTRDVTGQPDKRSESNGKVSEMMRALGEYLQMPVVLEGNFDNQVTWLLEKSADFSRSPSAPTSDIVDAVLETVGKQMSLQLKRERRTVTLWDLEPR